MLVGSLAMHLPCISARWYQSLCFAAEGRPRAANLRELAMELSGKTFEHLQQEEQAAAEWNVDYGLWRLFDSAAE